VISLRRISCAPSKIKGTHEVYEVWCASFLHRRMACDSPSRRQEVFFLERFLLTKPSRRDTMESMTKYKKIYFGIGIGEDKDRKPLVNVEGLILRAQELIAETFGGFHMQRGKGGWLSPTNGMVLEDSIGFIVYANYADDELVRKSVKVSKNLKDIFNQEDILVACEPVDWMRFVG